MFPYAFTPASCTLRLLYFLYIRTCEAGHTAKKHAKVLLFFDMSKYFYRKNQKSKKMHFA